MTKAGIYSDFEERGNKAADDVAGHAVKNKQARKWVLEYVFDKKKRVKNAAGKTLRTMSELDPGVLFPYFDVFVDLYDWDDSLH